MNILIQLIEIITLKRRPQDLQYDEFAAAFYVVFSVGLSYVVHILGGKYSSPLAYAVLPTAALLGLLYGVLAINSKQNRFVQTCTALFGVQTIISLAVLAFSAVSFLRLFLPFLMIWNLYISVLIIKESLEASWIRALLILVGIQFISVMVLVVIFPEFFAEFLEIAGIELPEKAA